MDYQTNLGVGPTSGGSTSMSGSGSITTAKTESKPSWISEDTPSQTRKAPGKAM